MRIYSLEYLNIFIFHWFYLFFWKLPVNQDKLNKEDCKHLAVLLHFQVWNLSSWLKPIHPFQSLRVRTASDTHDLSTLSFKCASRWLLHITSPPDFSYYSSHSWRHLLQDPPWLAATFLFPGSFLFSDSCRAFTILRPRPPPVYCRLFSKASWNLSLQPSTKSHPGAFP